MSHYCFIAYSITKADSMSGGDRICLELIRTCLRNNHQVTIITNNQGQLLFDRYGIKASYILLPDLPPDRFGLGPNYIFCAITGLLTKPPAGKKPDYLISASHFLPDLTPAWRLKLAYPQISWSVFLNMLFPSPFKGYQNSSKQFKTPSIRLIFNWFCQELGVLILKKANRIFCINQEIKTYLLKRGFHPNQLVIFVCGHRVKLLKTNKKSYEAVFVGRFHPQKGFSDLIPIWKIVVKSIPTARLAVIGSATPGQKQQFLDQVRENRLSANINYLGFIKDDQKVHTLMQRSKLFLFPSYYESFGVVVMEALACGLPVVSYSLPIIKTIYKQGVIFSRTGYPNKLAIKVISLLRNPSRRRKIGLSGQAFSQNYTWPKVTEDILKKLYARSNN
jgi:glycosyltransferase involved in cell wall biosynthesis